MPDIPILALCAFAAITIVLMPGPRPFALAGRTLAHGVQDGLTALAGGLLGAFAAMMAATAVLTAIMLTSEAAFVGLRFVGTLYLATLAWQAWGRIGSLPDMETAPARTDTLWQAFVAEALRLRAVAFPLALLPQFVDPFTGAPAAGFAAQFMVLGMICVALIGTAGFCAVATVGFAQVRSAARRETGLRRRKTSTALRDAAGSRGAAAMPMPYMRQHG